MIPYLPTRFPLHIFVNIAYEASYNESVRSTNPSVSDFYSAKFNLFLQKLNSSLRFQFTFSLVQSQTTFFHKDRHRTIEKATRRERPTTCACPWQVTRLPRNPRTQLVFLVEPGTPGQSKRSVVAQTAPSERQFGYDSPPKQPRAPKTQFLLPDTKFALSTGAHAETAEKSRIVPRWDEQRT